MTHTEAEYILIDLLRYIPEYQRRKVVEAIETLSNTK